MAQGLVNGYSVGIELTRVCSLNDFQLVLGLYRGHPLFLVSLPQSALLFIDN